MDLREKTFRMIRGRDKIMRLIYQPRKIKARRDPLREAVRRTFKRR